MILQEERLLIDSFKEKMNSNQQLSKEDLLAMCTQFEDTIELASVSMKIINRLRVNYLSIQASK
ncbi:MAG: hypothetical protein ABJ004_01655 [Cyclobacteriaceae bacterium]